MLDSETKNRINACRDILVGKVPDPKSQVEQITIALIYKFMDDMDTQAEELGGKRGFFTGAFARYAWSNLLAPGMKGEETLLLYQGGLVMMPKNLDLPPLFRDIFKNAYLPYRDPETLRSFLKEIDGFTYDHSERLGDAFEYLLSVLGSQGDAGQFRTPRHVIDFLVALIDPQKNERILDPACGTAGFLISAWKHILEANREKTPGDKLTPKERARLTANIHGYDISPDMVRLSQVNLYLHGFADPHIDEYDTLTNDDRWNEHADVILANPPFMSPKGGIKPHKKFSISATRSEVLFVDYIAEHLTPNGRAAIVVPEGVIFQNGTAYKQLRKMLVTSSLVAVVSLPSGVFNPYSGVKTSVLIFDKRLAKRTDFVLFLKVNNDGFGLGAQRRETKGSDLPKLVSLYGAYKQACVSGELEAFAAAHSGDSLLVERERIGGSGEWTLSGERYRAGVENLSRFEMVKLGDVCMVERGASPRPINDYLTTDDNGVSWIKIGDAPFGSKYIDSAREKISCEGASKSRAVKAGDFILSNSMSFGRPYILRIDGCIHDGWLLLRENSQIISKEYLYYILSSAQVYSQFKRSAIGGVVNNLNSSLVRGIDIPLPSLTLQQEIVGMLEEYQRVIDGALQVVDGYKPRVVVRSEWPLVELPCACEIKRGRFSHRPRNDPHFYGGNYPFIQTGDVVRAAGGKVEYTQTLNEAGLGVSKLFSPPIVLVTIAANIGDVALLDYPACFPDSLVALTPKSGVDPKFLALMMQTQEEHLNRIAPQAAQKNINIEILKTIKIPLPDMAIQLAIVEEIEEEKRLVSANKQLIERFQAKIKATLDRVWGEI